MGLETDNNFSTCLGSEEVGSLPLFLSKDSEKVEGKDDWGRDAKLTQSSAGISRTPGKSHVHTSSISPSIRYLLIYSEPQK